MVLHVEAVARSFGGVFAVRDVTMSVADGEFRGLIGPNGAGKSTLFNLISGHLHPDRGHITYAGKHLERLPPYRRARAGMAIVFQAARLFRGMTAMENVMVGAHAWSRHGFAEAALRIGRHHHEERDIRGLAESALARVGLADRSGDVAEALPLGQQRALQVARALCAKPRLLLLDEPASGLRAGERAALADLLAELHQQGMTMVLVEHDVAFVTRLADRVTVLDLGEVIAEGTPEAISRDQRVISAYLGEGPVGA